MKNDFELVRDAKAGIQSAYTELYNRHYHSIYIIIYQLVKNTELAEELCHVTFIKAFQRIETFVEDISFFMWLKTIATNTVIDFVRRTKKEQGNLYIDDETNFLQLQTEDSLRPDSEIVYRETVAELESAISNLKYVQRNLLQQKLAGKSYKEIAEVNNMTEDQVKSGLHKARVNLKKQLTN